LGAQILPYPPLVAIELHALSLELVVHLSQTAHLRVIEIQPSLHDLGETLAELTLQPRSLRPCRTRPRRNPLDPLRMKRSDRERG
jgi:hypothetical protein